MIGSTGITLSRLLNTMSNPAMDMIFLRTTKWGWSGKPGTFSRLTQRTFEIPAQKRNVPNTEPSGSSRPRCLLAFDHGWHGGDASQVPMFIKLATVYTNGSRMSACKTSRLGKERFSMAWMASETERTGSPWLRPQIWAVFWSISTMRDGCFPFHADPYVHPPSPVKASAIPTSHSLGWRIGHSKSILLARNTRSSCPFELKLITVNLRPTSSWEQTEDGNSHWKLRWLKTGSRDFANTLCPILISVTSKSIRSPWK